MHQTEVTEKFVRQLSEAPTPLRKLEIIAGTLSKTFKVGMDEIGIFTFDQSREMLVFVWPNSLRNVGSIPLNAHKCLATKTALEKTGEINNNFASSPHLQMFENFVPAKDNRMPIQKIMSVPVMHGDELKGVIQVARKGADRESAGPDFSQTDLNLMSAISSILAEHL